MTITAVEPNKVVLTELLLSTLGYSIQVDPKNPAAFRVYQGNEPWQQPFATKEAALEAASEEAVRECNLSQCQNCCAVHIDGNLKGIKHYHQRVEDGEREPSGECPDCGCLCHWIE